MTKKYYEKKLDFQQKLITRQSGQISSLKAQIEKLENQIQEKDKLINSVSYLKEKLSQNILEIKKHKESYKNLIEELKRMKKIINQEVYNGRWRFIKFLIK